MAGSNNVPNSDANARESCVRPPSRLPSSSAAARVIVVWVTNASIHEAAPLNHAAGEGRKGREIGRSGHREGASEGETCGALQEKP